MILIFDINRFIIMSFNIIKQVLLCPEFKMPKQIDDEGKCRVHCPKWVCKESTAQKGLEYFE